MAGTNPKIDSIIKLIERRNADLGNLFSSLAEIHPDIAEGFIAKMRNFVDDDPVLLDDRINIVVREHAAVSDAFKKIKDLRGLDKMAAYGGSLGKGVKTEDETKALTVTSQGVESAQSSHYQETRKKYLDDLGLPENATKEQIKKAYRQKMIEHHPDMAQNRGASEEEIKVAHEKTIYFNNAAAFLAGATVGQQATAESGQPLPGGGGVFQGAADQTFGFAKGKIQGKIQGYLERPFRDLAKRFTKQVSKEVAETTAKTATKTAVKTGAKMAVSTATKVGVEAAFASTGVGLVVDLVIEVGTRLVSLLGKVFNKLNGLLASITGTDSKRENFFYLMLAGGGTIILVGGSPILGLGAVGLGAAGMYNPGLVTGMVGGILLIPVIAFNVAVAMVTALFQSILLAIFLILIGTTFIFFIIQFGAYVVPQGGFGTRTEERNIHGNNPPPGYPGYPYPPEPNPPGGNLPPAGYFGSGAGCDFTNPLPELEAYTCEHGAGVVGFIDAYACIGSPVVAPFDGCIWPHSDSVGGTSIIIWPTDPSGDYQDQETSNCPSMYLTHLSDAISGETNDLGCIPVTQGQVIGHTGCSGNCGTRRTPPHTHMGCSTIGLFFRSSQADVNCVGLLSSSTNFACESYSQIDDRIHAEPIECLLHPYN